MSKFHAKKVKNHAVIFRRAENNFDGGLKMIDDELIEGFQVAVEKQEFIYKPPQIKDDKQIF